MLPDHLSARSQTPYTLGHSSHMSHHDRGELLEPFLQAFGPRKALEIPQETILGAITHFLSNLPLADLPRFTTATLDSEHLWASEEYAGGQLNQAISLAVSGKVADLEKRHQSAWCASRKISSSSRRWLDTIQTVLESSEARSITVLQFRVGLLSGIGISDQVIWGEARVNLEEQVVLGVSELGLSAADQRTLAIVCEVVHHVEPSRLRILDLQVSLQQSPSLSLAAEYLGNCSFHSKCSHSVIGSTTECTRQIFNPRGGSRQDLRGAIGRQQARPGAPVGIGAPICGDHEGTCRSKRETKGAGLQDEW